MKTVITFDDMERRGMRMLEVACRKCERPRRAHFRQTDFTCWGTADALLIRHDWYHEGAKGVQRA